MAGVSHEHHRALRAVVTRVGLLSIFMAGTVLRAPAADDRTRKPFDADQIRRDMAKVRARFGLDKKRPGVGKSTPTTTRRNPSASVKSRVDDSARAGEALSYRFAAGKTFGYAIDIRIKRAYKSERFSGTPIFSVRSVDQDGNAVVFAIGKFKCTSLLTGSDEEQERPSRTVWLGSVLKVSPSGKVSGKEDYKQTVLPVFLTTLIKPRELFFPELTASISGVRSQESKSSLWLTMSSGTILGNTVKQIEGKEKRLLRAKPLTGSLVELHKERGFRGNDSPPTVLSYASTSRFDRDRGLMVDSSAMSDTEEGPVTVQIRLLEGEELKQAVDQANIDWADRPSEVDAFELRRVAVKLDSPRRLSTPADARPGMIVAHNRDGNHWYLAQVVEVVDARRYKVKIRYRGSDEVLEVHPGELAVAPAGKTP